MKPVIYADNAATTKLDIDAFEAMKVWLVGEYANPSQPYAISRSSRKAIGDAREVIAECINASPDEIYFTSCGTESDNWVIKGTALSDTQQKKIITSSFEHHAILHSCEAVARLGHTVIYLEPTCDGYILPDILGKNMTDEVSLVSVMFGNNELGTIQPITELCAMAHSKGALFHTDAVQAVGHVPIDVKTLGVDFLSASAHKFNGPKGIGFLYIRKGVMLQPYIDGGSQEYGKRAGTENVASIVGMAVALKKNCEHLDENMDRNKANANVLLKKISESGIKFTCNGGEKRLPGILSLSFPGFEGEGILHRLDLQGICISTGSACDSKNTQISHVLKAIGLKEELARGTIRISLGINNTEADAEIIANKIVDIVKK